VRREWGGRWCVVQIDRTLYPQRFSSLSRARAWAKDWNNAWLGEWGYKRAVVRRFNRKTMRVP
jgi:hypothetical protein